MLGKYYPQFVPTAENLGGPIRFRLKFITRKFMEIVI